MINLFLVLNLVVILYVWFETDAFIEWMRLFKIKFFKYEEYFKNKVSSMPYLTYVDFIEGEYGFDYFICRLITCPICLSVWCNIFLIIGFLNKTSILWLGPNILLTWIIYFFLKFILKKLNE